MRPIMKFGSVTVAIALLLAGCASTPTTTITNPVTPVTTTPLTSTQKTVNNIIQGTQAACGFIPAALDVATLVSSNTGLSTASAAIKAICGAVTKTSTKRKLAAKRYGDSTSVVTLVDGIIIRGTLTM